MNENAMCYVASKPGMPGYYFASVIDPAHAKDTAKEIARIIRQGGVISQVPVVEARKGLVEYMDAKRKAAP